MAAALAIPYYVAHLDSELPESKNPRPRIGLDDGQKAGYMFSSSRKRCDSVCMERGETCKPATPPSSWYQWLDQANENFITLFLPPFNLEWNTSLSELDPPPSYHDAVADTPPTYETNGNLDQLHCERENDPSREIYDLQIKGLDLLSPMTPSTIDFGDSSNFRQAGNNKKKKAATKAKWAGSGDEGNNEDGGGEENGGGEGGGEGGGAGNNEGGGAGDDGGGDDWNTGNKKKKGKKGKAAEEEEKKKREEEEQKQKDEAQAASGGDPLSWANEGDANPDDEWGGFTTTAKKGKKGKKDKAEVVPDPPAALSGITSKFDDINLDDTPKLDLNFGGGETGTKDVSSGFGFGGWGSSWNTPSKWELDGADLGSTDTTDVTKSTKDTSLDGFDSSWSFGGNKKSKKKTTTSGFDFRTLGGLDETKEEQEESTETKGGADDWATGLASSGKQDKKKNKGAFDNLYEEPNLNQIGTAMAEPVVTAEDTWGGWEGASSKKDKKKGKKGEVEDVSSVPPPPPPPPVAPVDAMDEWGAFSTKKDKKKGKKGATEDIGKSEDMVVVVPDAEPEADLGWGNFGSKKDKKKGKKGAIEEEKPKDPDIVVVPDPEPEPEVGGWGSFGTKKDKKKGKKIVEEERVEEPVVEVVADPEPEMDLDWGSFGAKKGKKKGKKGVEEVKDPEPAAVLVPDPAPEADTSWTFGSKKDKKKGKKTVEEEKIEEPAIGGAPETETHDDWGSFGKEDKKRNKKGASEEPDKIADPTANAELEPEVEPVVDSGWGAFATKKEKKRGKKGATEDPWPTEDNDVVKVPESEPVVEDMLSSFTSAGKKEKKGKKGGLWDVKEDPISTFDFTAGEATATVPDTDNWMDFGSDKKKDKKGKKGTTTDTENEEALTSPPPPPPPPVPVVPDVSTFETWGTSKKDKDKKNKKGKVTEPEPAIVAVPDPVEETKADNNEDDWGTWGLSSKDKKKKEKEREQEKEEQKKREQEEKEREEQDKKEEEEREKEKEKGKTKVSKKVKTTKTADTSKPKDLTNDSMFDATPAADDMWGSWGTPKDKKKGGNKDITSELPPPAPTPPAQGLTPEPTIDDIGEDDWGEVAPVRPKSKKDAKKSAKEDSKATKKGSRDKDEDAAIDFPKDSKNKESPKDETPAKAAKGFWGSIGTTPTSKSKTAKEKDKDKEIENAIDELDLGADSDEIVEIIEEPIKKGSKSKTESKPSKSFGKDGDKASKDSDKASKLSDKKKKDTTADVVDEATVSPKDSKSSKSLDAKDKSDDKKDDAWGFWGSSKKTSGKKADESKKEITKQDSPNQKSSLKAHSNEPEGTSKADEPPQSTPSKSSKTTMSASKTTGKLTVAQKVKALEEEKKKVLGLAPPPVVAEFEPLSKADSPPQKLSSTSKSKTSKTNPSKKKDLLPPFEEEKKVSKDSVPGSFPGEGGDEDLIDMIAAPIEKKLKKKDLKPKKEEKVDLMDFDSPMAKAPPTPPEEPTAAKPAKKERARVVRDEGASSWGFWAAAPKKDVKKDRKSKDDDDVTSPAAKERTPAPGLSRSKSTKTAKEKETEKSKSSSSDKAEKEKKVESRPSKSRQSSFGGLFGGPPPSRTKPVQRTSTGPKSASRRQSMDVDATGLPSPPADAPDMTPKAAKLMGMGSGKLGRKESTRGKQKASVIPDPYAIDDDDMVMVNGLEDPVINAPIPKKTSKKEKSSKSNHKAEPDLADDIVMVESGPLQDGPEHLAFDEKPRGLQRSMTSAKKPDNKIMGLFGGFGRKSRRASDTYERPKTKIAPEDEGNLRRKRTVTGGGDAAKRLRRDDRKVRRSDRDVVDADGFVTDAAGDGGAATEAEDAEARKEERRAKRAAKEQAAKDAEDAKLRDEKERRAKRREAERAEDEKRKAKARDARDRRARKEEEAEAIRHEEKRARRAAREERTAKEDLAAKDLETPPAVERRSKHRSRDIPEAETSRPRKSDRRRSHMDNHLSPNPFDDPDSRERRSRPKTSRRKSTAPVEDYFDPRNGSRAVANEEQPGSGYPHNNANDHTSSWVKSQLSDPAPPPPIEPTVIEPAPVLGGAEKYDHTFVAEEDERRAMHRKSRRHSKYAGGGEDGGGERKKRREEVRSEESEEGRVYPRRKSDFVLGAGVKTGGAGVPGAAGKRGSWFQRVRLPL